ncbi:hypothetical protein BBBOND_0308440 [Babesia bigemina]|uniref:Ribosome binding protein n=1 Tax=Babesia bigemina TaxID=5866 RepID=A0A061DE93_BABBI|nr:hypothetical protein BBBOND_0308440 [Babesia bigemina]CDR96940.1 hypothetical protein BBBOND_0308440 [Babesia bigemina]|eukprot:XP_012769126.1 hypothetical protein BBBOND_0308440 [Babesia bigemina]
MSGHGVKLDTLKDCFQFLEWLNGRNGQKSNVVTALVQRLTPYFPQMPNLKPRLQAQYVNFLNNVSALRTKLLSNKITTPSNYVNTRDKTQILDALLGCIPKFLAALYYLQYHVDDAFSNVGGGDWASQSLQRGELCNFLTTGNNILRGGFSVHEVNNIEGRAVANELRKILNKEVDTRTKNPVHDHFRNVTLTISNKPWHAVNTGNTVSLVNVFCVLVAGEKDADGGAFKAALDSGLTGRKICWEYLKEHCKILKQHIDALISEGFSATGRAFIPRDPVKFATKAADWFRAHLPSTEKVLKGMIPQSIHSHSTELRPFAKDHLYPNGFIFDGSKPDVLKRGLPRDWTLKLQRFNQLGDRLIRLKGILDGSECGAETVATKAEAAKPTATKTEAAKPTATKTEAGKPTATKPGEARQATATTKARSPQGGQPNGAANTGTAANGRQNTGGKNSVASNQNNSQSRGNARGSLGKDSASSLPSSGAGASGPAGPKSDEGKQGPSSTGSTTSPSKNIVHSQQPQPQAPPVTSPQAPPTSAPAAPGSPSQSGGGGAGGQGGVTPGQKPDATQAPASPQSSRDSTPGPQPSGASAPGQGSFGAVSKGGKDKGPPASVPQGSQSNAPQAPVQPQLPGATSLAPPSAPPAGPVPSVIQHGGDGSSQDSAPGQQPVSVTDAAHSPAPGVTSPGPPPSGASGLNSVNDPGGKMSGSDSTQQSNQETHDGNSGTTTSSTPGSGQGLGEAGGRGTEPADSQSVNLVKTQCVEPTIDKILLNPDVKFCNPADPPKDVLANYKNQDKIKQRRQNDMKSIIQRTQEEIWDKQMKSFAADEPTLQRKEREPPTTLPTHLIQSTLPKYTNSPVPSDRNRLQWRRPYDSRSVGRRNDGADPPQHLTLDGQDIADEPLRDSYFKKRTEDLERQYYEEKQQRDRKYNDRISYLEKLQQLNKQRNEESQKRHEQNVKDAIKSAEHISKEDKNFRSTFDTSLIGAPVAFTQSFNQPMHQLVDSPFSPDIDLTGTVIPYKHDNPPAIPAVHFDNVMPPPDIYKVDGRIPPTNIAGSIFQQPRDVLDPVHETPDTIGIDVAPKLQAYNNPNYMPTTNLKPRLSSKDLHFEVVIPPKNRDHEDADVKLTRIEDLVQFRNPVLYNELWMPANEKKPNAFDFTVSATDGIANTGFIPTCRNPWSVSTSSTDTVQPPTYPVPASDQLPLPRTVREMLYWFVGLNQHGLTGIVEKYVKNILVESNKDISKSPYSIKVTGDPDQLTASMVTAKLTEACLYSATVIYKIRHNNDFEAFATFDFESEYGKFRYSSDPAGLLCQLRDYVYACCHQLEFLKAQCERDKLSGGWQGHEYGHSVSPSDSPLQAFLTDGWDCPFDTHPFDPYNLCRKSRIRMGFKEEDLSNDSQTGNTLSTILTPSCGGEDPLVTLSSYLNCLTRRTPRTTGELVSYFHHFGNSLHDAFDGGLLPLGNSLRNPHLDCPDWDRLGASDLDTVRGIRGHESIKSISNSNHNHDHPRTLSTLVGCGSDPDNCPPHCSPITYRAYALYSQSFAHTYLSWTVYLPDRLWGSLQKLCNDMIKYKCSDGKPLHLCSTALPLLYSHGFTPPEVGSQQQLKCSDVISKLKEIVNGGPIASLMTCMDYFLYNIREPFMYALVALWSAAFLIFANTMLYRLDILHIRSHLIRTKASHRIDVKALLTKGRKMLSLYKDVDYFDEDPIGQLSF